MADNKDTLICPACGEFMVKVAMSEAGCNIDICTEGCGGIWFDNRELAKMDEKHESIDEILAVLKNKTFKTITDKQRYCPVCSTPMVKNFVSAKKEIQIDECYNCGGKFMDRNELTQMRNQYNNDAEREADVLKLANTLYGGMLKAQDAELKELQKTNSKSVFSIFRGIYNTCVTDIMTTEDNELDLYNKIDNK